MNKRILVSGACGFLGSIVKDRLDSLGYEVWGVDLRENKAKKIIGVDLTDAVATKEVFGEISPFDLIIHTAALAHGQKLQNTDNNYTSINLAMTRNLVEAINDVDIPMIFFSSVAVYGEAGRNTPIAPDASLRPSTDYGRSKKVCESFLNDSLNRVVFLRMAPVFDQGHMDDVRKRGFLPGLGLKVCFFPESKYSLANSRTVVEVVESLVKSEITPGIHLTNVADAEPYGQHKIASWFPGKGLPLWTGIFTPLAWLLLLCPGKRGYKFRCLFHKFFCSNVYQVPQEYRLELFYSLTRKSI